MTQSITGQKVFGSGYFYGVPTSANPTPTAFGATQTISADFKRDVKSLHGTNQLAIAAASGKLTVTGKVELATLNGRLVNDLLLGTTLATGQTSWVQGETHTVPALTPFTVTITPPGSGTFGLLTSLVFTDTNVPGVAVASGPAAGQYSIAGAVLTFATADASRPVSVDYTYTASTSGQSISMTNQPMGETGNFQAIIDLLFGSEKTVIQFNNAISAGFALATKLDDFMLPTFEYMCATDTNNILGTFSFAEVH